MMWLILFVCVTIAWGNVRSGRKNNNIYPNNEKMSDGVFPPLKNVHYGSYLANERDYLWVARVIHSRSANYPYLCTASCISPKIFITAATCIDRLKVSYVTIIYNGYGLPLKAMVLPENMTRQGYDDIGFLITKEVHDVTWHTIKLYDGENRTHEKWFTNTYWRDTWDHKVIGFGSHLSDAGKLIPEKVFTLQGMGVIVNYYLCRNFLLPRTSTIYNVPCYSSCVSKHYYMKGNEYKTNTDYCEWLHQVLGSALLEKKSGRLIGVSTWSAGLGKFPLPVGFSVPNSENFYKNYRCAQIIRDDKKVPSPGYLQTLCKN